MSMPRASAGDGASTTGCRLLLSRIEARTGVPTSIMIAIYGHETAYGQVTGNLDPVRGARDARL